jgi:hypothetical protein
MDTTELKFTSGEARYHLFFAFVTFVNFALATTLRPGWWSAVLAGFIGYCIWQTARLWRRPYIQLGADELVVFDHGRPRQRVALAAVAAVRKGFNRTILLMSDGLEVSISHLNFGNSDDARRFRQALDERVPKAAA